MSTGYSAQALLAISLLLSAPVLSIASECSVKTTQSTSPMPPRRTIALERHEKIKAMFPDVADAVIIGDSMAQRWPRKKLHALFDTERVLNLGVRSDRTQNILWRMDDLPLTNISPSRTVLFAGTNNLADDASPCEIAEGIEKIVKQLRANWPSTKIFVVEILPRGFQGFSFRDADRKAANGLIADAASKDGFTFVRVDERALTCDGAGDGECPNFIDDQTHLSMIGYEFMTEALAHVLKGSE